MVENEKLQEKLGEALGLEIAAQKTMEELSSMELFRNDRMLITRLQKMQQQAGNHQSKLEQIVDSLPKSEAQIYSTKIYQIAEQIAEKCHKTMQTYLGDDPDSSEAIEFLCVAESGEVIHYEVLSVMSKKSKIKKLSTSINSILREEKRHLRLCTRLAKRVASESSF
jgi:ferritin-like metal-binding protein YciE